MSTTSLRDNSWLESRLHYLWNTYYQDATLGYPICVTFGPRARYRYGSIYSVGKQCHILVNRLFAHPDVPDYVVDATLAHELAHYVHGYGSGLRKLHAHPHRGGVVDKEMQKRGCFFLEEQALEWRRSHWPAFYAAQAADVTARREERDKRENTRWEMYLSTPGFRTEEHLNARLAQLAPLFGFAEPPFEVRWLLASLRRSGLSYRFNQDETVRLHGALADSSVPASVIDYELSYWLAASAVGGNWRPIEQAMKDAGLWAEAQKAIRWRRTVWPKYCPANHPLRVK